MFIFCKEIQQVSCSNRLVIVGVVSHY